jgi:hypothetical protein
MLGSIKKLFRWIYRSAVTGRFVSKDEAKAHKRTTVRERVLRDEGDQL